MGKAGQMSLPLVFSQLLQLDENYHFAQFYTEKKGSHQIRRINFNDYRPSNDKKILGFAVCVPFVFQNASFNAILSNTSSDNS